LAGEQRDRKAEANKQAAALSAELKMVRESEAVQAELEKTERITS